MALIWSCRRSIYVRHKPLIRLTLESGASRRVHFLAWLVQWYQGAELLLSATFYACCHDTTCCINMNPTTLAIFGAWAAFRAVVCTLKYEKWAKEHRILDFQSLTGPEEFEVAVDFDVQKLSRRKSNSDSELSLSLSVSTPIALRVLRRREGNTESAIGSFDLVVAGR